VVSKQSKTTLREITAKTVREICAITVREDQNQFVAPNAISIAQAYFDKNAWFRGIYADDTPVGFVMLEDQPEVPEYFLWRFMIAAPYQAMGFGCEAIRLLVEHVRTRPNATELLTSCVPGEGSPQGFYERQGFVWSGEVDEGEHVLKLTL